MSKKNRETAPDFCLPLVGDGEQQLALSDFRGKAVLITFWVTWCPACQQDLPQKEVFYRSLDSERVDFITVNVTGRETYPEAVTEFLEKHRLTFPVLRDNGTKMYDAYGITSVPTSVLIGPDGRIDHRYGENVPFVHVVTGLGKYINE